MPIINFSGSDALLDLAVLNQNDNDIKPSQSFLNLSRTKGTAHHNSTLPMDMSQQPSQQQEPEDDIISAITNDQSIYPGKGKHELSTSHHSMNQFHSSFATAFANVVMRRGSECGGTTSTPVSSQHSRHHNQRSSSCKKLQPQSSSDQSSQKESYDDLLDKINELQKENDELNSYSEQAIKCINDLTEKQIKLQQSCQKELEDAKETTEMYKKQQDDFLMTIKLLTHEKEELKKELISLRNNGTWNRMTDKMNPCRNLVDNEIVVNIPHKGHRRSLSDESSLNSNVNHLTTHKSINTTGQFTEPIRGTITPCTTATTNVSCDNQSYMSISDEQHQVYNDICDRYLFDKNASLNSSFRSRSSAGSSSNHAPSIMTTNRNTYKPETNTIQEDIFYDSDDTSSWGAKQLQRRVSTIQRQQRSTQNQQTKYHSTTHYKGNDNEDDLNDDDSDVRTLQFDEQKQQHQQAENNNPVSEFRNILDHVPIISVRNKNNSNRTLNKDTSNSRSANNNNNKGRRPTFPRYAGNGNINPGNWLPRTSMNRRRRP